MTLPFNEKVVNDGEISIEGFKYPNFVGFLDPNGIPIKFEDKFGYTGHGGGPSIQEVFRSYYRLKIRDSEKINHLEKYNMSYKYLHSEKERYSNYLKENIASLKGAIELYKKKYPSSYFIFEMMNLDIYTFLLNCYSAETFFEGVGNIETCMCEEEYFDNEYKYNREYSNENFTFPCYDYYFQMNYNMYKDGILVDVFKNVMIQNLGYHSVERVPKTITISVFNIYETFYNYLLNDFTIYQIPKMIFDNKQNKYIERRFNEFLIPDSELRLKDEIESIKKLVPINERFKYYR